MTPLLASSAASRPVRVASVNPSLTIVLASTGAASDIVRAGAQLAKQAARSGAEMIVVVPESITGELVGLREIPDVRILSAPIGSDRGTLCALAMQMANGDVVSFRDESQVRDMELVGREPVEMERILETVRTEPTRASHRAGIAGRATPGASAALHA